MAGIANFIVLDTTKLFALDVASVKQALLLPKQALILERLAIVLRIWIVPTFRVHFVHNCLRHGTL